MNRWKLRWDVVHAQWNVIWAPEGWSFVKMRNGKIRACQVYVYHAPSLNLPEHVS